MTTGAQSHGSGRRLRVPADRLRAYQPAHPVKLAKMARTEALGVGCSRDLPSRCVLLYAQ